jgi:hypothetical protein
MRDEKLLGYHRSRMRGLFYAVLTAPLIGKDA